MAVSIEDWAAGIVEFRGGGTLTLEVSYLLNQGADDFSLQFCGDRGGLRWPELDLTVVRHGEPETRRLSAAIGPRASVAEMRHFAACIRGEARPLVPPRETATVVKIIAGLYQAQRRKDVIEL
ncbi:MAG: hypothetical protein A2107_09110 [Verrucomicrobia bacterium GWF2_62_7]|nr:MAG: hypothetical protein A2107_09110 [Verrucomicrobia bacterium GWF2_62_7]